MTEPLPAEARAYLAAMSREVELLLEPDGLVAWADGRAESTLGLGPGDSLAARCVPSSCAKLAELLEAASAGEVRRWEVTVVAHGAPTTLAVSARPFEGRILALASLVPTDYGRALGEIGAAMDELEGLHRETERQRRELVRREEEILRVGQKLADSNRGVVALHAELDESQHSLRHAAEVKSRVVANVSHEFRTPLNSILGLSKLLLDRADGDLTPEQEKQVGFIRRSAESLAELVSDLLDISQLESGKTTLRIAHFTGEAIFGALRGMLRPLAAGPVELVFDEPEPIPLETDEGKVNQVLRNLVSNALKFTEAGEVRVSLRRGPEGTCVFRVKDTGIGIAPEDQARVFEEFVQIDGPVQRRVKGTGLGLSLAKRLAAILGGELTLESAPGKGSTFTLTIPAVHPEAREMAELTERSRVLDPSRAPILVVEDDRQTLFLYERYLSGAGFQVIPARTIDDARAALARVTPAAVVLDVMLEGETTWTFLADLKSDPRTCDVPTLVVTVVDREEKARALGADEFYVKPLDEAWLIRRLKQLARKNPVEKVLVIDDDEISRYVLRRLLEGTSYTIREAASGREGVRAAQVERPHVIFLDFVLPDMTAFDVLDELKHDPTTRGIPVIVHTSKDLAEEERARLAEDTRAILSKQSISRELAIGRIRDALVHAGIGQQFGSEA